MTGKTHIAIGIAASVGISALFLQKNHSMLEMGLFVCLTAGGSLLPDVDHPNATLSRRLSPFSKWLHKYYCIAGTYLGNDDDQIAMREHRGICHSLSACLSTLFPLSFYLLMDTPSSFIISGIILGMFLHILSDSLTPLGVMMFAPFDLNYYRFGFKAISPKLNRLILPIRYRLLRLGLYIINLILSMSWFLYFLIAIAIFVFTIETIYNHFPLQFLPSLFFLIFALAMNILLRYIRCMVAVKIELGEKNLDIF